MAGQCIDEQRAKQDDGDAGEVHGHANPLGFTEERPCKERDHRELSAAGHKGSEHSGCSALTLVTNGAAGHDAGDGAARTDDEGDHGFAGKANLFEDGVQHDGCACHVATILKECDEKVHHHYERQEADHGRNALDDALENNGPNQIVGAAKPAFNDALEPADAVTKTPDVVAACKVVALGKPNAGARLGDPEHRPHDERKDRNAQPFIGQHSIDFVANVSFLGEDLAGLHGSHNDVYKLESLTVGGFHNSFIGKVDITLMIRSFLRLARQGCSGLNKCLQTLCRGGYCVDHGTAQLGAQGLHVDLGVLLLVEVALIEGNHHGNAKLQ